MDTYNQAKKVLENINTYVHVGKFETGLRTNLKRVKSKCYTTTYEYNGFLENATKLAFIAEVNKTKFYYTEIKGNKFIAVTYMGVCNVFQLFCVSLPEVKQYTDSEIENMYNDLQTGNTIQFETKIGTLSASVMAPGNFSIRIQGHVSFAIPNRFENFYDYIKKYTA